MALNQFLAFSQDPSANVLSQTAYSSDSQRLIGNQPGIARSQLVNKALRQSSVMTAALAQFIADRQPNDVLDSVVPATLETYLQAALANHGTLPSTIDTTTRTWWRKSSDGYIEQGISGIPVPPGGGFNDVIFPIPFLTTVLDIQCQVYNAATDQVGWSNMTLSGCRISSGVADAVTRIVNICVRGY
jgi:hypothetical protein